MEAIQSGQFTLKKILQQSLCSFLDAWIDFFQTVPISISPLKSWDNSGHCFLKNSLCLDAVFIASTETIISFCKESGFLPAVTALIHTFDSDLKRHAHIHCIVSAGGLKLTEEAERFTREPLSFLESLSVTFPHIMSMLSGTMV